MKSSRPQFSIIGWHTPMIQHIRSSRRNEIQCPQPASGRERARLTISRVMLVSRLPRRSSLFVTSSRKLHINGDCQNGKDRCGPAINGLHTEHSSRSTNNSKDEGRSEQHRHQAITSLHSVRFDTVESICSWRAAVLDKSSSEALLFPQLYPSDSFGPIVTRRLNDLVSSFE